MAFFTRREKFLESSTTAIVVFAWFQATHESVEEQHLNILPFEQLLFRTLICGGEAA